MFWFRLKIIRDFVCELVKLSLFDNQSQMQVYIFEVENLHLNYYHKSVVIQKYVIQMVIKALFYIRCTVVVIASLKYYPL